MSLPSALDPLINLPNWLVWKLEPPPTPDGKWIKVPYQARKPESKASSTDPSTWATHREAVAAFKKNGHSGIGFCLLDSGFAAFDIDDCRNADTGELHPWAAAFVERVASYTEVTTSGTGLRIIGTGSGKKIHRKQKVVDGVTLESYRLAERYIAMTGDRLPGAPDLLANIDEAMDQVVAELDEQRDEKKKRRYDGAAPLPRMLETLLYVKDSGAYPTRSELLFAFLTGALRARVSEATIVDTCLDPTKGGSIFEHCRAQENSRAYVERQVKQAWDDVEKESRGLDTTTAADLGMEGIEWLWPGRFARGKIGLIAGLPDYGKGQIACFLAAAVTAGVKLPCDEGSTPRGNVIWFNAEDGARDTLNPRLAAAGADRGRVHVVNASKDGKMFSLATDLGRLREAIKRIGDVVLVIIDPISAYLGVGKVDGRSATDVRGVLTPLKDLAEEFHVLVLGIAHFNKKDDVKSALLRVSDSIAYVAAARHVYAVVDNPEDKNSKLFVKAKNNLARDTHALQYCMGEKTVGRDERLNVDIVAPFAIWYPQHVAITANEAMESAGGKTAKREAKEFLNKRLAAGPVESDILIEEAKQEDISEKTLRRAKKDLGVKVYKDNKDHGKWFWSLQRWS
jgi:hypothetical protein